MAVLMKKTWENPDLKGEQWGWHAIWAFSLSATLVCDWLTRVYGSYNCSHMSHGIINQLPTGGPKLRGCLSSTGMLFTFFYKVVC